MAAGGHTQLAQVCVHKYAQDQGPGFQVVGRVQDACVYLGVSAVRGGCRGTSTGTNVRWAALPVTVGSGCRVAVELGVLALMKGGQKEAGCNHEEDEGQCGGLSAGVQLWVCMDVCTEV